MEYRLTTNTQGTYTYPTWSYQWKSSTLHSTISPATIKYYFADRSSIGYIYEISPDDVITTWNSTTRYQNSGTRVEKTNNVYKVKANKTYSIERLRSSSYSSSLRETCFKCTVDLDLTVTRETTGSLANYYYVTLPSNSVYYYDINTSGSVQTKEHYESGTYLPEDRTDEHWGDYREVATGNFDVIFDNSNILGSVNYSKSIELSNKLIGSVCPAELSFNAVIPDNYGEDDMYAFEVKFNENDSWKPIGFFWIYSIKYNSQNTITVTLRDGLGFVDENAYKFFSGSYSASAGSSNVNLPVHKYSRTVLQPDVSSITLTRGQGIPVFEQAINTASAPGYDNDGQCFRSNQVYVDDSSGSIKPAKGSIDIFDYAKTLRYSVKANTNVSVTLPRFTSNEMRYQAVNDGSGQFNLGAISNGEYVPNTGWTSGTYVEGASSNPFHASCCFIKFLNSTNLNSNEVYMVTSPSSSVTPYIGLTQSGSEWVLTLTNSYIYKITVNVEELTSSSYYIDDSNAETYLLYSDNKGYYYDVIERNCVLLELVWDGTYDSNNNKHYDYVAPHGVFYNGKLYNSSRRTVSGNTMTIYFDEMYGVGSSTTVTRNANYNTWTDEYSQVVHRRLFDFYTNPIALKTTNTVYDILSNMSVLNLRQNAKTNATYTVLGSSSYPSYVTTNIENKWIEEGMTYREVLEDIAMLCNGNMYLDEYNNLQIKNLVYKGYQLTEDMYKKFSYTRGLVHVPTGIQVDTDNHQRLIVEGDEKNLAIFHNNFCDVQNVYSLTLTYIYPILARYNELSSFEQIDVTLNDDYNIMVGDIIKIETATAVVLKKDITTEGCTLSSTLM